jgi:altronate hydrolase
MGGTAVLTEVPEMFGAETVLFDRCVNKDVFDKGVKLINDFKQYFKNHGQPVSENPSPGNKEGGITTLEEKSLGCVQKGGTAPVVDVLDYGDTLKKQGLNLLNGPGNDIVSITNLSAVGCHLVLFTTGRGTPLGGAVPTIKIASNDNIAAKKSHWIDYSAFGFDKKAKAQELLELIKNVANGQPTKNEIQGNREIAIFKDGVTL